VGEQLDSEYESVEVTDGDESVVPPVSYGSGVKSQSITVLSSDTLTKKQGSVCQTLRSVKNYPLPYPSAPTSLVGV